ncbi:hypothetical protein LWI29_027518 [Acer saccharum]|uniref:Jacalin-type lectin domain-containing protein n=1 Tax=Acer saccharum TaxID=4024 RepID=A0AA39RWH8_ACESA|nr:hypothetical protein LWI29_027518 [Acer saccharum]
MVEKASYSIQRSLNELEAFQVGPFGEQKGREWSYKSKGAITGIMVTCDDTAVMSYIFKGVDENGNVEYSDTFGYLYKDVVHKVVGPLKEEECIKVGPWGWSRSSNEEELSYMLNGPTEIKIGYNGDSIKCMFFKSLDGKGSEVQNSIKTNTSYEMHEVFSLNWPEEYVVSISGTLRDNVKDIESLCFYTNRTIYGPFGTMKGSAPFRFYMKGGIIVGFHGLDGGNYFDALGVYIKHTSDLFSSSSGQGQIGSPKVKSLCLVL